MKQCRTCNQGIPDEAKKCPYCGKPAGGFWSSLFGSGNTKPAPLGSEKDPFALTITDIFSMPERGTTAVGMIQSGTISLGERVRFVTPGKHEKICTVTCIWMHREEVRSAKAGDTVGLLLDGAAMQDIAKGIGLTKAAPAQE